MCAIQTPCQTPKTAAQIAAQDAKDALCDLEHLLTLIQGFSVILERLADQVELDLPRPQTQILRAAIGGVTLAQERCVERLDRVAEYVEGGVS